MDRFFCRRGSGRDEPPEEEVSQIKSEKEKIDNEAAKNVKQLFEAIREIDIKAVEQLIKDGVNVKEAVDGPAKSTVLHCLAEMESTQYHSMKEMFKLLLNENCSVDSKDKYGNTPLKLAAEKGNATILNLLLENNADPTVKDKYSEDTPLHWAAKKGKIEAVQKLCQTYHQGRLINLQNKDYQTPLHLAVEKNQTKAVIVLLIHGADKSLKDKDECIPLDVASRKNYKEIEKILTKPAEELMVRGSCVISDSESTVIEPHQITPGAPPINVYVNVSGSGPTAIGNNANFVTNVVHQQTEREPLALGESSLPSNVNTRLTERTEEPTAPLEEEEDVSMDT